MSFLIVVLLPDSFVVMLVPICRSLFFILVLVPICWSLFFSSSCYYRLLSFFVVVLLPASFFAVVLLPASFVAPVPVPCGWIRTSIMWYRYFPGTMWLVWVPLRASFWHRRQVGIHFLVVWRVVGGDFFIIVASVGAVSPCSRRVLLVSFP